MSQTMNFTGKKEIPEKRIDLDVDTGGESVEVVYSIEADEVDNLNDLRLVIQGNYRGELSRYEREDLPEDEDKVEGKYSLDIPYIEKEQSGSLTFNVYFVEGNLIRRYCEHISVSKNENRKTILPVVPGDTGKKFWKIKYNDYQDGPILVLNKEVGDASKTNIKNEATSPEFIFKVYPAVVREILNKLVYEEEVYSVEGASSEWTNHWMRFAEIHSEEIPDLEPTSRTPEGVSKWVDEVIRNFMAEFTGHYYKMIEERSAE